MFQFGSVVIGPKQAYVAGEGTVAVSFRSANPRNNMRIQEGTFLSVDKLMQDGTWKTVFVDGDWCTRYGWELKSIWGDSYAQVSWQIPPETSPGSYRICHFGTRKILFSEPEWMSNYSILISLVSSLSHFLAQFWEWLGWNGLVSSCHIREFSGCTTTFLVQ